MKWSAVLASTLLLSGAVLAQPSPVRRPPIGEAELPAAAVDAAAIRSELMAVERQLAKVRDEEDAAGREMATLLVTLGPEHPKIVRLRDLRDTLASRKTDLVSRRAALLADLATQRANIRFFPAIGGTLPDKKIDLDLQNLTPKEAYRRVFEQAGLEASIDEDVPDEPRVSLAVRGVRLSTALELLGESTGLGYSRQEDQKYRVGKREKLGPGITGNLRIGGEGSPFAVFQQGADALLRLGPSLANPQGLTRVFVDEERSTFHCPHCKGQVTTLRKRQQPACPKCSRTFQEEWQFCPADGTKRPAVSGDWKFCPLCGKEVRMQKSDRRGAPELPSRAEPRIPILSDIPYVERLFRVEPVKPPTPKREAEEERQ